jgi:hypothetical protein
LVPAHSALARSAALQGAASHSAEDLRRRFEAISAERERNTGGVAVLCGSMQARLLC